MISFFLGAREIRNNPTKGKIEKTDGQVTVSLLERRKVWYGKLEQQKEMREGKETITF